MLAKINLLQLGTALLGPHTNQVVANLNDHCLRIAVNEDNQYPWHSHPDSDELFVVLNGHLRLELVDGSCIDLYPQDCYCVPRGVVHRTQALGRTVNLCYELATATTVFV
ncbi:MAG: cupin domain-containing protein [Sphingobacteriia bacterium]|jgi:mannose-6-phosphate isomerase-like protein (cupin superfamily)